jgi:NCAIR mutase (PurE)-related protein
MKSPSSVEDGMLTEGELRAMLEAVQRGSLSVEAALQRMSQPTVAELGYATLDLQRQQRCGFPEVVFAEGKTKEWIEGAVRRLRAAGQDCFVTRVNEEQARHLAACFPEAEQDRLARTFWWPAEGTRPAPQGRVCVVTAGTSDLPVAQEALVTARVMGANVEMIVDVGVAGVHRILRHRERLAQADAIVVVAGMDGALPSVVGGLVPCPVIACPTSVGYGASFGGVAALLTMLNSCAAGVAVVNIDAGFKAGDIAARIARRAAGGTSSPAPNPSSSGSGAGSP